MPLTRFERFKLNLILWVFGTRDVPLIGTSGGRIVEFEGDRCVVRVPLNRRNKNHLGSMYFGALCIGADTAGGLVALQENRRHGNAVNFIFKDFRAEFLKRPEDDTHFTCTDGATVRAGFDEALRTGERVNVPLNITATTPAKFGDEPVAQFHLTLSLKKRSTR